jgi:hypothetical protein
VRQPPNQRRPLHLVHRKGAFLVSYQNASLSANFEPHEQAEPEKAKKNPQRIASYKLYYVN